MKKILPELFLYVHIFLLFYKNYFHYWDGENEIGGVWDVIHYIFILDKSFYIRYLDVVILQIVIFFT